LRKTPRAPRVRQFEAFISYSHSADEKLAKELQRALNRVARPSYKWWQWWPPRIFRDQTGLVPTGDLAAAIERALLASDAFVLLASPLAAASPWVDREVATWRAKKPLDRLFLALTEGGLAWDDARGDFDPAQSTALPPSLRGAFEAEPLWVDFTGVREDRPFARDPGFLDGAATLAAAIRRTDKDALVGEDVRQRRRTRQLVGGAIATLTLLAVAATIAAIYAFVQRNHANERARIALSRQYAAQAIAALEIDPEQSLGLAARAATTAPTDEAENALRRALRTSRLRSIIDAHAQVFDVEPAPKPPLVAAALKSGKVRVWNSRTGRPVVTLRLGDGAVRNVSFSADGNRVLAAGRPGAAVWSTSPGASQPLATFDETGKPLAAALSPDGELAATGGEAGVVRLWRARTGAPAGLLRPPGEPSPVTAVAFSSDGSRLVAASGARTAVWSLRTTAPPLVQPHEDIVFAVALSPDGRLLATGDRDGLARIWNLGTGRAVDLNGHEATIRSLAFSPDGRSVVTASDDETGRLWDAANGRSLGELQGHDGPVLSAAFAPGGRSVLTGGQDGGIRIWALAADPVQAQLVAKNEPPVRDVAFHPDGRLLVTASEDRKVRVWDSRLHSVLHVFGHGERAEDWVESARFGRDGRLLVSAGDDGTARVWDGSSGALLATLGQAGGRPLHDAALSPDGELVAAGGNGPFVRVWRWRQQKLVLQLRTPAERVDGVAFSPDGELLAAAAGQAVRIWPAGSATASAVLPDRGRGNELSSVAFDPSGTLIAAGSSSGAASIWDVHTEELVARVIGHGDTVWDVAFSGDGRYLVTAGQDGFAKVWTVPGGGPITSVRTGRSSLEGAAFSPRGRRVAVAGADGRVTVFECAECRPLEALVCLAASRVTPRVRAREPDAFGRCD
jgi:WD40 repeat protein